jgi:AraC-like DNA-binding protein
MNNDEIVIAVTSGEKKRLREHKIKVGEVHHHSVTEIISLLNVSKIRAMELYALSEFQSVPSVGIRFASDLISMGFYSLHELKKKNGAKLTDQYEVQCGVWADPCVEDQFRLVVHYAHHPDSKKNWWDFTAERKAFRLKSGYPSTRPKKPWFELPRFQTSSRITASKDVVKKDLHQKLKKAIKLMKDNSGNKLTIAELAKTSNLSVYHFIRCFKSAYEQTPVQFLTGLRLKKACQLLRTTNQNVKSIMWQCGFENESSFIRLFKQRFKMTPTVFRSEVTR